MQTRILGSHSFASLVIQRILTTIAVAQIFTGFTIGSSSAAAPQNDSPKIKNVLFIVSDDLKASVLGCYGDTVCHTPNIDRLAKSGVVFEHAYCQGTICAPSRLSFMHSRYQGGGTVNLGQHFQANGFFTARVGKIYHMRVPGDIIAGTNGGDIASTWTRRFNSPGQEAHTPGQYACLNRNVFTTELQGRESTKMPHRPFVTVSYDGDGSDQPDYKSATTAIEVLRQQQGKDESFLLAVGLVRPHYPMVAPKNYFDLYPLDEISLPEETDQDQNDIPKMGLAKTLSRKIGFAGRADNQKRMWAGYYASVTFMDEQVGRILSELERLGLRESTAIVFTSDHGYHLGEHGFWQKANLHEEVTRVPLIIATPGGTAARTDSLAELVDLYPTLSDLVGLEVPKSAQGVSLVPVLTDPSSRVRNSAISLANGLALRTENWAYMRYNDGSEELYDMRSDPKQFVNLANSDDHVQVLSEHRATLDTRIKKDGIKFKKRNNKTPNP